MRYPYPPTDLLIQYTLEFLDALPPSTRMSAAAHSKLAQLRATMARYSGLIPVVALRDYEMAGHGEAREGDIILVSRESYEYLLNHNTTDPLIKAVTGWPDPPRPGP